MWDWWGIYSMVPRWHHKDLSLHVSHPTERSHGNPQDTTIAPSPTWHAVSHEFQAQGAVFYIPSANRIIDAHTTWLYPTKIIFGWTASHPTPTSRAFWSYTEANAHVRWWLLPRSAAIQLSPSYVTICCLTLIPGTLVPSLFDKLEYFMIHMINSMHGWIRISIYCLNIPFIRFWLLVHPFALHLFINILYLMQICLSFIHFMKISMSNFSWCIALITTHSKQLLGYTLDLSFNFTIKK